MIIFKEAAALQNYLTTAREARQTVGFVPTMGALHQGHLSLIGLSKAQYTLTVCSIFVNPTQFNNPEDFAKYPITIEQDLEALLQGGCDVLFLPSSTEIYPPGYQAVHYALGSIEAVLEGAHRPGHFQGVCQVVDRLLDLVSPHALILGQKDFQQCLVLGKMLELTGREGAITLQIAPTVREPNGLAMSSRNLRLSEEERDRAALIYSVLNQMQLAYQKGRPADAISIDAREQLERAGFDVDYAVVVSRETLLPAAGLEAPSIALIAAALGPVRLIDNLPFS
jgi:pantoate--beta-alanine ligase